MRRNAFGGRQANRRPNTVSAFGGQKPNKMHRFGQIPSLSANGRPMAIQKQQQGLSQRFSGSVYQQQRQVQQQANESRIEESVSMAQSRFSLQRREQRTMPRYANAPNHLQRTPARQAAMQTSEDSLMQSRSVRPTASRYLARGAAVQNQRQRAQQMQFERRQMQLKQQQMQLQKRQEELKRRMEREKARQEQIQKRQQQLREARKAEQERRQQGLEKSRAASRMQAQVRYRRGPRQNNTLESSQQSMQQLVSVSNSHMMRSRNRFAQHQHRQFAMHQTHQQQARAAPAQQQRHNTPKGVERKIDQSVTAATIPNIVQTQTTPPKIVRHSVSPTDSSLASPHQQHTRQIVMPVYDLAKSSDESLEDEKALDEKTSVVVEKESRVETMETIEESSALAEPLVEPENAVSVQSTVVLSSHQRALSQTKAVAQSSNQSGQHKSALPLQLSKSQPKPKARALEDDIAAALADADIVLGDVTSPTTLANNFPKILTAVDGTLQSNFSNQSVLIHLPVRTQDFVNMPLIVFFDARPLNEDLPRVVGALHFNLLFSRNSNDSAVETTSVERRSFQRSSLASETNGTTDNETVDDDLVSEPTVPTVVFIPPQNNSFAFRNFQALPRRNQNRFSVGRNTIRNIHARQSQINSRLTQHILRSDNRYETLRNELEAGTLVEPVLRLRERLRRCAQLQRWSARVSLQSVDAPSYFIDQTALRDSYLARTGDNTVLVAALQVTDISLSFFVEPTDPSGIVCGDWTDWYEISSDLQTEPPVPPSLPATAEYSVSAVFSLSTHPSDYEISWQVQLGQTS